ncbi:DNA translocase FtsK 4TM domain-containing protein [Poriferisphaera sp. WC338]|uniref:FtsK/SpoIIIE family DNA translocase n=1 Tax=Poriferisphaera sp. WC338 TaxID=3425129 RepID=UPI003D81BCF8
MAKKRKTKKELEQERLNKIAAYKFIGWVALAAVWLLVTASMLSYDALDYPAHDVGVQNAVYGNWIGKFGAFISHKVMTYIGGGAWMIIIGVAVYLGTVAIGKKMNQLAIRGLGLVVMAITLSCLMDALKPPMITGFQSPPQGAGGWLASYINDELLINRVALPGTLVILLVMFLVGSILTADHVMLAVMRFMGDWLRKVSMPDVAAAGGRVAGNVAGNVANQAKEKVNGWRPWQRWFVAKPAEPKQTKRKKHRMDDDTIDEDAGGFAGTESFDTEVAKPSRFKNDEDDEYEYEYVDEDEEDGEEYEYEYEDEDEEEEEDNGVDAPSAYVSSKKKPKKYDANAIAEKIRNMPINKAVKPREATSEPPRSPEMDLSGYKFPELDILEDPSGNFTDEQEAIVREQAIQLESALREYKIKGEVVGIDSGPVITLFEVRLAPGTKVARINAVQSDLARAMKAQNVRIVSNMAGKDTVGFEVPNIKKEMVRIKELMCVGDSSVKKMKLPMYLGKDASGNPLIADLNAMPHMLIAGTTGSGKSVCMNSIIMSFLFTKRPDELKLVLVDPKMVEMSMFKDIPHLMCPVVTEMGKAAAIMEWAVTKMDERYELLAEAGVRDIASYNGLEWEELKERMEPATPEAEARIPKKLPYLVLIIDELADLMMTNKEVEGSIVRIAQKARAVGIHLILATQRPQANVVTGLIKSNMPCRVAFKVASGMDSRIVLDQKGGELLLGHGDMLFLSPRTSKLTRAQGCLVDDFEIRKTVKFLKTISSQSFEPSLVQIKGNGEIAVPQDDDGEIRNTPGYKESMLEHKDELFDDAVRVVLESQRGSVSLVQRRLGIGYGRSARLIEMMEETGILGKYKEGKPREVYMTIEEWNMIKAKAAEDAETDNFNRPVTNQEAAEIDEDGVEVATAEDVGDDETEWEEVDVDEDDEEEYEEGEEEEWEEVEEEEE